MGRAVYDLDAWSRLAWRPMMYPNMMRSMRPIITIALLVSFSAVAAAQDTRSVTEPRRPDACTVLRASLVPVGDTTIAETDEGKPDTRRIQDAIDHCARGTAVGLSPNGTQRAFL